MLEMYELLYKHVECLRVHTHTEEPHCRGKNEPSRFEVGEGDSFHSPAVEDHYHTLYFEILDLAISSIEDHFD